MGDCEGLYDDLDDTDLGDQIHKLRKVNENLKIHIRNLESDIAKLMNEVIELKKTQVTLAKNISELFKTAQAEIKRKDNMIADLRSQLDDVILRRVGNKRAATHETQNNNSKRVRLDNSGHKSEINYRHINESKNLEKQGENIGTRDENISRRDENIGRRDENIGRRDESIGRRDENIGRRDESIGRRDENIGRRDENIGRRDENISTRDENIRKIFENQREVKVNLRRCDSRHRKMDSRDVSCENQRSNRHRGEDFDNNPRRSRERYEENIERSREDRNRRSNSRDFQRTSDERFRKSNSREAPNRNTEKRIENKDRLANIRESNDDRRSRSTSRDNRVDSRASSNNSLDSMRRFPNGRFRKMNHGRYGRKKLRRDECRRNRDCTIDMTIREVKEIPNGNDKENVVKQRKKDMEEKEEGEISIIDSSEDEAEVIFIGDAPKEQRKGQDESHQDRKPIKTKENRPIENSEEKELTRGKDTVKMMETRPVENYKEKELPDHKETELPAQNEKKLPARIEKELPLHKEKELPVHTEKTLPARKEKELPVRKDHELPVYKDQIKTEETRRPTGNPKEQELPMHKKSMNTNSTNLVEIIHETISATTEVYPVKEPELREIAHLKEELHEPSVKKSVATVVLNKSEQVAIRLECQSSNDSALSNNVTLGDSTGDSLLLTTSKPGTSVRRKRRRCVVQLNDD